MFSWLRKAVAREFRNAPIATTVTLVGAIAGALFFLLPERTLTLESSPASYVKVPSGHLIGIFGALATSTLFAGLSRFAFRYAKLPSFGISLILAAISVVLTTIIFGRLGVGFPLDQPNRAATDNLIFWLNIVVFLAINGEAVAKAFVRASYDPQKDADGVGTFAALAIGAMIWSSLLGRAQEWLVGMPTP